MLPMADTIHGEELKEKKWWVPEEEEEEYLDNVESKGSISLFNLLAKGLIGWDKVRDTRAQHTVSEDDLSKTEVLVTSWKVETSQVNTVLLDD